jgi:hypothetical protein
MTTTRNPSDYRSAINLPDRSQTEGVMDEVSEAAQEVGSFASEVVEVVKARPYTTVAIAGGLAFAIGALWMVRKQTQQSTYESLLDRLPSLPDRQSLWPRNWR